MNEGPLERAGYAIADVRQRLQLVADSLDNHGFRDVRAITERVHGPCGVLVRDCLADLDRVTKLVEQGDGEAGPR